MWVGEGRGMLLTFSIAVVKELRVWSNVRGANKVSEIPLMALWSVAVNKVEKQPWRQ